MNVLAIDTSTSWAGVALEFAGVRNSLTWQSSHNHGRELAQKLVYLMGSAGCNIRELDCVAVALGPGGFSAVRVGVSCALGIASPRGLTTVGIPTHYFQARAKVAESESVEADGSGTKSADTIDEPFNLISAIPVGRDQRSIAYFDLPLGAIDSASRNRICNNSNLELLANAGGALVAGEVIHELTETSGLVEQRHPRPPEVMLDIAIESVNLGLGGCWQLRPIYAREPTITPSESVALR